jgi:hypothetical protein
MCTREPKCTVSAVVFVLWCSEVLQVVSNVPNEHVAVIVYPLKLL